MIKIRPMTDRIDIDVISTCKTFLRYPLMWVSFLRIDNCLIDSGNTISDSSKLVTYLKTSKTTDQLFILNTHLHEDHCGNNNLLINELGAKILAQYDRLNFNEVTWFYKLFWGKPEVFKSNKLPPSRFTTDTGRDLEIIHTPGHTPCHVSYYLKEEDILITGDSIPLPLRKIYCMPEEDYEQMIITLKALLTKITEKTIIIDSHRGILRNPRSYIKTRIENMEEVVEQVRKTKEELTSSNTNEIAKKVFGRQSWRMRFAAPRYSLENTIKSIG